MISRTEIWEFLPNLAITFHGEKKCPGKATANICCRTRMTAIVSTDAGACLEVPATCYRVPTTRPSVSQDGEGQLENSRESGAQVEEMTRAWQEVSATGSRLRGLSLASTPAPGTLSHTHTPAFERSALEGVALRCPSERGNEAAEEMNTSDQINAVHRSNLPCSGQN